MLIRNMGITAYDLTEIGVYYENSHIKLVFQKAAVRSLDSEQNKSFSHCKHNILLFA